MSKQASKVPSLTENSEFVFGLKESRVMKGVGVCLMLFHHLFFDVSDLSKCHLLFPASASLILYVSKISKVCVAIFVLLSGYGLLKSYEKWIKREGQSVKSAFRFLISHLWKLLTQYWWCVVPFAVFGMATGLRPFSEVYGTGAKSIYYFVADCVGMGGRASISHMFNATCWYIALAIGLYCLFPLLHWCLQKNPFLFCGVVLFFGFLPVRTLLLPGRQYLIPFGIGMLSARFSFFEKMREKVHGILPLCGLLGGLAAVLLLRESLKTNIDGPFAFLIICLLLTIVRKFPTVGTVLDFLGKHSANIFMTHTFFYLYFCGNLIYAPKYPFLIFLFLLGVCLVYSFLLEKVKFFVHLAFSKKVN